MDVSDAVTRSRPLAHYLDSSEDPPLPADFDVEVFFEEWRDVFDSEDDFADRLEFSGLTPESAREAFESTPRGDPESIPSAFETAEAVVERAVEADDEDFGALAGRNADSPFVDLLAPLAHAGQEPVSLDEDWTTGARESLTDWLFERLTQVFQHPLFLLFKAYQRDEYPDTDFADATDSTAVYDEFVAAYRDYDAIFEQYPVLVRLLGTVVEQWRRSVQRLDERVASDRADLARTFADGRDPGRIADAEPLSDDPHGDGEIVFGIHFANDCSVVYKPRSVGCEAAFNDVLDWVNARTEIPDLLAPTVLDRGEYGWMNYLAHDPCESVEGVERFYERMGGLTALAFVLGSTDLHHNNVRATGEHPVILDHETVMSADFDAANSPSSPAASSFVEDSILSTVLVPVTGELNEEDARAVSNSGLNKLDDVETEQDAPHFRHPNADAMELTFGAPYTPDAKNLPVLDGEQRDVTEFLDELKRGFREVATTIRTNSDDFSDALSTFEGQEIRHLLRPTGHYASKLTESVYSSKLRSGLQQSLGLEDFYRIFVPSADGDLWKLVPAEKATLRRFTIPRFTLPADGHELRDGFGDPQGVFAAKSPLACARERVADLDEHWIETQLQLVDLAFTSSDVAGPMAESSGDRTKPVAEADAPEAVVSNVLDLFAETTTEYPDGTLRWAEFSRTSPSNGFLVQEPKPDLYKGYAGVGLFLAAVAAVRDDPELADQSRRVLKPLRLWYEDGDPDAPELPIGGIAGRGSVAYALATAGDFLDDPDLTESARTIAKQTTREEIESDADLDAMTGVAGELLAQLAVYDRTGDEALLDRARWCGDRLLDVTTETDEGYRVPTTEEADRRFAFAHGVGAMGYALLELGERLGEDEYAEVGRDALEFDVELWRRETDADESDADDSHATDDHDDSDDETQIWGWCNGAAGVGLNRVVVTETVADESAQVSPVRQDLQTDLSLEDSLCCGSAGRALFMLNAGETFEDPDLVERGEELFENLLDRAEREGRLRLGNHLPMLPRFGLFTGLAGIGYLALQFEARESDVDLPNVMRLE